MTDASVPSTAPDTTPNTSTNTATGMTTYPDAATAVTSGSAPVAAAVATLPKVRPRRKARVVHRRSTLGPNIRNAFSALFANRLRSLLTALGVIVGVAAVIGAVTLTQGTSASINARISGLGTNTLTITPGALNTGGVRSAAGSAQTLTLADANSLTSAAGVKAVTPILRANKQIVYGSTNWNTFVEGTYPNEQSIGNWTVAEGSWFTAANETSGDAVAVLGQTTEQNLFATSANDPIGQTVLIAGTPFRIIGVLQAKGTSGFNNQDDVIYVPFTAAQTRLKSSQYVDSISVQVDNANDVNNAETAITQILDAAHHISNGGTADFTVRSSTQLVQTAQTFATTLTFLLVGIAAISLLVGGIGIMNIMLVSVTERTREIGIRMAVGARRSDVRNQFLIEALALSVVGGVLGIAVGLVAGYALTRAMGTPFGFYPLPIVLAFAVSAAIGVGFGFYPAVRASRLDPIDALRSE